MNIMQNLSSSGELAYLSTERIWQETIKALQTTHPDKYFETLYKKPSTANTFS